MTVSLRYDERNRIKSVVLDDGTLVGLIYDATGLWQGFSFPDGGKMLFVRNTSGEIIGATRVAKPASQQTPGANRFDLRRVGALTETDCAIATAALVAAAATAVATCLEGPSVQCVTATAAAAVAAARAYEACKDKSVSTEESAT